MVGENRLLKETDRVMDQHRRGNITKDQAINELDKAIGEYGNHNFLMGGLLGIATVVGGCLSLYTLIIPGCEKLITKIKK